MRNPSGTVAVVVVTWNSADVLPGLIDSLPAGLAGLDWQLVVVDNDSADDTVACARRLRPEALVVESGRNAGYAAAINQALREADRLMPGVGPVLVCNPDIRMLPGCGRALVAGLDAPGTGITAPLLREADGTVIRTLRREPTIGRALGEALIGNRRPGRIAPLGELVTDPAAYRTATRADWATGALLAISPECRAACGPWDESFFLYSEETEYALRARDLGFATRLVPEAVATHLGGESKTSVRLWTLLVLNRVRLYRKRHGRVATAAFWGAVLVRETSRAALGKATSRSAAIALLRPSRLRAVPGP